MSNDELQEAIDAITRGGVGAMPTDKQGGFAENEGLAKEMMDAVANQGAPAQQDTAVGGAGSVSAEATRPVAAVNESESTEGNRNDTASAMPMTKAGRPEVAGQNEPAAEAKTEAAGPEVNLDAAKSQELEQTASQLRGSLNPQFGGDARAPEINRGLGFAGVETERTNNDNDKEKNIGLGLAGMGNDDQKAELRTKIIKALYPLLDKTDMKGEEKARFCLEAYRAGIVGYDALEQAIEASERIDGDSKVQLLKEIWDIVEG